MKGFLEGAGGAEDADGLERPRKEANAEGVSEVASTGGGRPVILAKSVRSQRRIVNMPRMEPRALRRLANCSATEIIAARDPNGLVHYIQLWNSEEFVYRKSLSA